jgi:PAS domain S-box-containing protein
MNNSSKKVYSVNYNKLTKVELIKLINKLNSEKLDENRELIELQNERLRQTQHLLEQSRDLYVNLYDYSPVSIVTLDKTGVIRNINLTLSAMLGVERRFITGTPFFIYIVEEFRIDFLNFLRDINSANEVDSIEIKIKPRNNDLKYVQIFTRPVFDYGSENYLLQNTLIDITEKKLREIEIENALKEKLVLLKEVHHRVKNNMQIIASLLNLQSMSIKNEEIRDIFLTSRNRINAMALIHENLYKSNQLSDLHTNNYLTELITNIFDSYPREGKLINLILNLDNIMVSIDTAVTIGLLVNELVSNALKYAFHGKDEGEIRISFINKNENIQLLEISDNGIGLPQDIDINTTKTLGLLLVNSFVDQLHGNIEIIRERGTIHRISFNVSASSN